MGFLADGADNPIFNPPPLFESARRPPPRLRVSSYVRSPAPSLGPFTRLARYFSKEKKCCRKVGRAAVYPPFPSVLRVVALVPFPSKVGAPSYVTHTNTHERHVLPENDGPPPPPSNANICRKLNKERSLPPLLLVGPRGLNILNRLNNRRLPSLALAHADNDAS